MYKMGFVAEAELELGGERGWVDGVGCVKVRVGWVSGGLGGVGRGVLREIRAGENERLKGRWGNGSIEPLYVRAFTLSIHHPSTHDFASPAGSSSISQDDTLLTVRSGLVYSARGP